MEVVNVIEDAPALGTRQDGVPYQPTALLAPFERGTQSIEFPLKRAIVATRINSPTIHVHAYVDLMQAGVRR
jgi:hypothetical protein